MMVELSRWKSHGGTVIVEQSWCGSNSGTVMVE